MYCNFSSSNSAVTGLLVLGLVALLGCQVEHSGETMAAEQNASNGKLSEQMTIDSSLVTNAFESIDTCLHWGGEVGDQSEERNQQILTGIERDCALAVENAQNVEHYLSEYPHLAAKIILLIDRGHYEVDEAGKNKLCESAHQVVGNDQENSEEKYAYQNECRHASLSESINDWIIVPGERFGPITKQTSESELIEIYGAGVVRREDLPVEESESLYDPGTVIYPDDPLRKVSIKWHDEENYRYPSEIYVWGDSSLWRTDRGITLGTTVRELEALNEKPFGLAGFGWDYGGTVLDSNGGVLVELGYQDPDKPSSEWLRRALLLRVGPKPLPRRDVTMEEYDSITGDIRLLSDHPVLRKVKLKVHDIIIRYDNP